MNIKTLAIVAAFVATTALGAGIVGAQDTTAPERPGAGAVRALIEIVVEETGLEPEEIITQLQEGTPLADIISASGGDVDAVVSAAVSAATDRINTAVTEGRITQEQADHILADLEDVVTRAVNGELLPNRPGNRGVGARLRAARSLIEAAATETGLAVRDIMRELRSGSTLADIISANNGSVDNVVASAVADATEQINAAVTEGHLTQEQADELIASLQTVFTDAVNGELPERPGRPGVRLFARGIVRQVAEATGLEIDDVVEQLQSGATIADVLTASGVDVVSFTDDVLAQASERLAQAVANGRITQERADEMIARLTERLPEIINSSHPVVGNS